MGVSVFDFLDGLESERKLMFLSQVKPTASLPLLDPQLPGHVQSRV